MNDTSSLSSPAHPFHVAIIMDGNGRWAAARHLPRTMGHKAGIEAVRRSVKAAQKLGITHLTLYSFSSENWSRPEGEVRELMGLLRFYLKNELATLHKNNVRICMIGERDRLDPDIAEMIADAERQTKENTALTLTLALSYGGRQELAMAMRAMAQKVQDGTMSPAQVDEDGLSAHLYTHGVPDPDLVIRTSGEKRISNFLLWQSAYAEYVFMDVLWPDFDEACLQAALDEYGQRERRFGK